MDGWRKPRGMFSVWAVVSACLAFFGCSRGMKPGEVPVTVVPRVDLARYMGTWHEIAKYPNRFQKGCGRASAEYRLAPGGERVEVLNRCEGAGPDAQPRSILGTARVVDPATNAKLKVTFFWPFSGDYWILALGAEYEYAVVGTPDRKYLWFLARTPAVSDELYGLFLREAKRQGFDPSRVVRSPP